MSWYLAVLKKYAVFEGRARRKEYWYFFLFNFLINIGLVLVGTILSSVTVGFDSDSFLIVFFAPTILYSIAMIIPSIAVAVRRLHDIGFSSWWYLITLIPGGSIVLFIFALFDTKPGANQYGPDPKAAERLAATPPPSSSQTQ